MRLFDLLPDSLQGGVKGHQPADDPDNFLRKSLANLCRDIVVHGGCYSKLVRDVTIVSWCRIDNVFLLSYRIATKCDWICTKCIIVVYFKQHVDLRHTYVSRHILDYYMSKLIVLVWPCFSYPSCVCATLKLQQVHSVVQECWKWHVLAKSSDAGSANKLGWELYVSFLNIEIWYGTFLSPRFHSPPFDDQWMVIGISGCSQRRWERPWVAILTTHSSSGQLPMGAIELPLATDDVDLEPCFLTIQYRMSGFDVIEA